MSWAKIGNVVSLNLNLARCQKCGRPKQYRYSVCNHCLWEKKQKQRQNQRKFKK